MPYTIKFTRIAAAQFDKIPERDRIKVAKDINSLIANPRPKGYKKLKGFEDLYRLRCGKYRIIYTVIDTILIVTVIRIANRGDVYSKIERL